MKKPKEPRLYQCPTCGAMHEQPIPGVVNAPSAFLPGLRRALEMVEGRRGAMGLALSTFANRCSFKAREEIRCVS
jgi:hypothetical protein